MVEKCTCTSEALENRSLCFLDLKNQRIVQITADKERDPAARADAAHADDPVRELRELELPEQHLAVVRERPSVVGDRVHQFDLNPLAFTPVHELAKWNQQRWTADNAPLAAYEFREALERMHRIALTRFGDRLLLACEQLPIEQTLVLVHRRCGIEVRVPDFEIALLSELGHRLAVGTRHVEYAGAPVARGKAVLAAGELDADHEPLEIPFPWSWQRLVEIVRVEDQIAFRRCKQTEVLQVGVS